MLFLLQMGDEPVYAVLCKGKRYDCGDKLGYLKANVDVALAHREIKRDFQSLPAFFDRLGRSLNRKRLLNLIFSDK